MLHYTQATITLLAVINPMVCGMLLMQVSGGTSLKHCWRDATKAALTVLVILILSALLGKYVLQAFGISIEAFEIVGGVIIAYIGFGMFGVKPDADAAAAAVGKKPKASLSSLVMFAASPGTIATVIALSAAHNSEGIPVTILVGSVGAVFLTWVIMLFVVVAEDRINKATQHLFTRFMGLILISMGLQFVLTGWKAFMGV
jgi:multiple antibiotic resistance protein